MVNPDPSCHSVPLTAPTTSSSAVTTSARASSSDGAMTPDGSDSVMREGSAGRAWVRPASAPGVVFDGDQLRATVRPEALDELRLDDPLIVVQVAADPESVNTFRQMLREILAYGRPEVRPRM